MTKYDEQFYRDHQAGARRAAQAVVPFVQQLLQPASVLDVGCGSGAWLAVWREAGVRDVHGVDGAYVNPATLLIPAEHFTAHDLTQPLQLERQFDLVMSLEVAEHLPVAHAARFVQMLTARGPVVLFSAAIPRQGGVEHLNEQWPAYWAELFAQAGFVALDCLRRRFWHDPAVEWFYAQNMVLYARREFAAKHAALQRELINQAGPPPAFVHPQKYLAELTAVDQLRSAAQDLAVIPAGEPFILIDEAQTDELLLAGRRWLPFPERNGYYAGLPADDAAARAELERQEQRGLRWLVVTAPAFWWLDYYAGLGERLQAVHRCVVASERLKIFAFEER
jgi:SAM-dependent methyltransferase